MENLRITVAGKVYNVVVEKIDSNETEIAPVAAPVRSAPAVAVRPAPAAPKAVAGSGDATSPLAGLVQAIELDVGAAVNAGDLVITLEAMKMYTSINAPTSGTIKAMHVKVGDAVEEGQVLYTIA
jgi:biotin carboxyl carrier protein